MKSFDKIIGAYKYILGSVLLQSVAINVLGFVTPLYSLQLLDRVMSSASMDTLLMLTIIMAAVSVVSGLIGMARSQVVSKAQSWVERNVTPELMQAAIFQSCRGSRVTVGKFVHDLHNVNQFVTHYAVNFFFDVPWSLVSMVIIFLIHPIIGLVTLFGSCIIIILAVMYEKMTRSLIERSEECYGKQNQMAQEAVFNADALKANGMMAHVTRHFAERNEDYIYAQSAVTKRSSYITGTLKIVRMLLQMAIMGLGVYFSLIHEMTTGAVIANSILSSKVFGPFEQSIMAWRHFVNCRHSYSELKNAFKHAEDRGEYAVLPEPEGEISLEDVTYTSPLTKRTILHGMSLKIRKGEVVGMIGRNAAGKSTLAKIIAGIIQPTEGKARLDSVDIYQASMHDFGRHIGYLPQNWQLFNESVAKNIARLGDVQENSEDVLEAARFVRMHEMILRMPQGYETVLGSQGVQLSGGQLQGVALARAFFGRPKAVVLDEPTSNLDHHGEEGLMHALRQCKQLGITVVLITHDSSLLMLCDKIAVIEEGKIRSFGTREQVFAAQQQRKQGAVPTGKAAAPEGPAAPGGGGSQPGGSVQSLASVGPVRAPEGV